MNTCAYCMACTVLSLTLLPSLISEPSFAESTSTVSNYTQPLSKQEALDIFNDTWILVVSDLKATEADAHFEDPKNIVLLAIFGPYNTQSDAVISRYKNPSFFKGLPEDYTDFISRADVERAALHFTGHKLTQHIAPDNRFMLTEKGYFCTSLGDAGLTGIPEIKNITRQGAGYSISGIVTSEIPDDPPDNFSLQIVPGDAPRTWKRIRLKIN